MSMKTLIAMAMLWCMPACAQVYVPNALTLNDDGINEHFRVYTVDTLEYFNLQIFNIYGNKLLETNDPGLVWLPEYQYQAPNGIVWYTLIWRTRESVATKVVRGHINILR